MREDRGWEAGEGLEVRGKGKTRGTSEMTCVECGDGGKGSDGIGIMLCSEWNSSISMPKSQSAMPRWREKDARWSSDEWNVKEKHPKEEEEEWNDKADRTEDSRERLSAEDKIKVENVKIHHMCESRPAITGSL